MGKRIKMLNVIRVIFFGAFAYLLLIIFSVYTMFSYQPFTIYTTEDNQNDFMKIENLTRSMSKKFGQRYINRKTDGHKGISTIKYTWKHIGFYNYMYAFDASNSFYKSQYIIILYDNSVVPGNGTDTLDNYLKNRLEAENIKFSRLQY